MIQKGSNIALSLILISVWWPTSATVIKNSRRPWDISRLVMLEDGRRLHHKSMMPVHATTNDWATSAYATTAADLGSISDFCVTQNATRESTRFEHPRWRFQSLETFQIMNNFVRQIILTWSSFGSDQNDVQKRFRRNFCWGLLFGW